MKGIICPNPEALRVAIPLVKKLPYDEGEGTVYKYYNLGDYDCYIRSTGDFPEIDIAMELNSDKDLITTFTHKQSGESVRFEKLDQLNGNEIQLQEEKERGKIGSGQEGGGPGGAGPGGGGPGGGGGGINPKPRGRDWSQDQLSRALHVAQMLVDDFAERSMDEKVAKKKTELLKLIQDIRDPNDTRFVMRRIQELLNALLNSHDISQSEFQRHMLALKEIG